MVTDRINEFIWYSRLAVWAGAIVLLVQSITGRATGIMTLLGVLLLAGGLAAFLSGLALSGRRFWVPGGSNMAVLPQSPTEVEPLPPPESVVAVPRPPAQATVSQPVPTAEVSVSGPERGDVCPRCNLPLQEGQMAATCPVCETPQHAACWVENHFHCSTPECGGRGNLVAPGSESSPEGGTPA